MLDANLAAFHARLDSSVKIDLKADSAFAKLQKHLVEFEKHPLIDQDVEDEMKKVSLVLASAFNNHLICECAFLSVPRPPKPL